MVGAVRCWALRAGSVRSPFSAAWGRLRGGEEAGEAEEADEAVGEEGGDGVVRSQAQTIRSTMILEAETQHVRGSREISFSGVT